MNYLSSNWKMIVFFIICTIFISTKPLTAQVTDVEQKMVYSVKERLLSAFEYAPGQFSWPPQFEIVDSKEINAFATFADNSLSSYKVVITTGLIKEIEKKNNVDGLAFTLAHELNHIKCGHLLKLINNANTTSNVSDFLKMAFTSENEKEADVEGMKLMLKAGYSYNNALKFIKYLRDILGDYTPIEALSVDHPSWSQRLEYIDQENKNIWSSMSAFQNGLYFLMYENYPVAISCYQSVVKEFPKCYEAFANLGYAYLMQYYDGFDVDDIKIYNIGQIVVGGFYRRPSSLENAVRGRNEDIWWNAVGNLQKSLLINPTQPLVKANLAMAYLLDPRGSSLNEYAKYMDESLKEMIKDSSISLLSKSIVFLNAGAADISNNMKLSYSRIDSSSTYLRQSLNNALQETRLVSLRSYSSLYSAMTFNSAQIEHALNFNSIILRIKQNARAYEPEISNSLTDYLKNMNPASVWWKYANELYQDYCKKYDVKPENISPSEHKNSPIIPATSVSLNENINIFLSQEMTDVIKLLGDAQKLPVINGAKLSKYKFPKYGIEIIAGDEVVTIGLIGQNSPDIIVSSFATGKALTFRVGMPEDEYKRITSEKNIDKTNITLGDNSIYEFNYELGLAFLIKDQKVQEIVIIQDPLKLD